jgi:hypothetical protein
LRYRHRKQNTGFSLMYKWMKNLDKLKYKSRTEKLEYLPSGFSVDQTWGGLIKAWVALTISDKEGDIERKKYYAAVIQKLQNELGLTITSFPELQLMVLDFFERNQDADSMSDYMTGEELLKIMLESDDEWWKKVKNQGRMTIKR